MAVDTSGQGDSHLGPVLLVGHATNFTTTPLKLPHHGAVDVKNRHACPKRGAVSLRQRMQRAQRPSPCRIGEDSIIAHALDRHNPRWLRIKLLPEATDVNVYRP